MKAALLLQLSAGERLLRAPNPYDGDHYDFQWVSTAVVLPRGFLIAHLDYFRYPAIKQIREDVSRLLELNEVQEFWRGSETAKLGSSHGKLFARHQLHMPPNLQLGFNYWMSWRKLYLV